MAYGQVNTPGASGVQIAAARQAAQNALDAANAAGKAAAAAQVTADAAMEKAAAAELAANAAGNMAQAAGEGVEAMAAGVQAAVSAAEAAQETANTAKTAAADAATAAANAQAAADAVSEGLAEINSTINTVPSQSGTLTYTGTAQSPVWNSYDSAKLTIGGTTSATNAGSYTATFTPKDGYKWSDSTTTAKSVTWTIAKASLTVPSQSGTLTYTGAAQSPVWSNYSSAKLTIGGTTSATNAGSYTATFTPGSNYRWSDGTTAAKSVTWTIAKASGSLSISPTSLTLDVTSMAKTIAVTRAGNGTITVTSSNTAVATVSLSGTTITVTAKATGSATITVSVAAGTNHTAPSSKTCAVTVSLPNTTLANNTPAVIQQAARAGVAPSYWAVGDKIGIALSGTVGSLSLSGTYYAFILGFDHNSAIEGSPSIHFQFGKTSGGVDIAFVDSYYASTSAYKYDSFHGGNSESATNGGGWKYSYLRQTICPAFLAAMPEAWQNVIAACTKYTDNTAGGEDEETNALVTATSEKIFLPAEYEVFGAWTHANFAEQRYQAQYDYYANGNSAQKYYHNATTTRCYWLLRSPESSSSSLYWCIVDTAGLSPAPSTIKCAKGAAFAPCFKVA